MHNWIVLTYDYIDIKRGRLERYMLLRQVSESLILIRSAIFGAFFHLVTRGRTTVILGTLKVGSLDINSLTLNNSATNVYQNGVNTLLKMVIKNPFFCQKTQKFL